MTIAINLKVNDGLVLATDSATTFRRFDPKTNSYPIINVYENANKVFNLKKGLPIGLITWGNGNVGKASIATLVKDFRRLLDTDEEWKIDDNNYKIKDVVDKFVEFFYEKNYKIEYKDWEVKPYTGFILSGYSSNESVAEEWSIDFGKFNNEDVSVSMLSGTDETGRLTWRGQPEAITRLVIGYSNEIYPAIEKSGMIDNHSIGLLVDKIREKTEIPFVEPAMPIKDAIDFAEFLVDTTIKYFKFAPEISTVGGPVEIASITKHEGFKWIKRKHYFDNKYNGA